MPIQDKDKYNRYMKEYMRKRYEDSAAWIRNYKVTKGCMDCGYNKHHAGLEFDHPEGRDSDPKKTIARQMGKGIPFLKKEVETSEVVCGTCHNIRTWERRQAPVV